VNYNDELKVLAHQAVNSHPLDWLIQYQSLRERQLLRDLRLANETNFKKYQGQLDENDKLNLLINAIRAINTESP